MLDEDNNFGGSLDVRKWWRHMQALSSQGKVNPRFQTSWEALVTVHRIAKKHGK